MSSHLSLTRTTRLLSAFQLLCIPVFSLLLAGVPARAATITFSAPANSTADSDVFNPGVLTYGYDWSTAQTLNGVPFTATAGTTTVGGGNITLSGFTTANPTAFGIGSIAPFGTL